MKKRLVAIIIAILFSCIELCSSVAVGKILYASDGRTVMVDEEDVETWKSVGWFESPEDAMIITMYATDGRTIAIPQYYREAYRSVGWYNTIEEVSITMYSRDGRSLVVCLDQIEAYKAVGWYVSQEEVTVTMYDINGEEHTIFVDNIEAAKQQGLHLNKGEVMQLMFSEDGRIEYVPFAVVPLWQQVGWYRGGGPVDPTRPMIALTFDDGPSKHTERILTCLEKYNARATFFVVGTNAAAHPNIMRRADALGCEIGNHTWNHIDMTASSNATIAWQIASTNDAVYNAIGKYPALLRPPYGAQNSRTRGAVNMPVILWSVDTLDWKTRDTQKTIASVKSNAVDGSIVLMHDIYPTTAAAAEALIPHLLMQGYQLVTVSELIAARTGGAVAGQAYFSVK